MSFRTCTDEKPVQIMDMQVMHEPKQFEGGESVHSSKNQQSDQTVEFL